MSTNDKDTLSLLTECMKRSMNVIQEVKPVDLQGTLTEDDKSVLGKIYARTFAVGMGTTVAAGAVGLRLTGNVPISGIAAGLIGAMASASAAMSTFPSGLLSLLSPPQKASTILDRVVCPAVLEFEPCVDDGRCLARLREGERGDMLLSAYNSCKLRAQQLRQGFASAGVAAATRPAPTTTGNASSAATWGDDAQIDPDANDSPQLAWQQQQQPQQQQQSSMPLGTRPPSSSDAMPHHETDLLPQGHGAASHGASGWDARAAPPGSSWEAVRARHRAAQEAASSGAVYDEPHAPAAEPSGSAEVTKAPTPPGRRPKKNAYGDDVLD